ncbi:hypothetical protein BD410DRAFT_828375 [Rickenella mellea]|uniref:F-box domain-containing protein n=1 Tax=Rickenella mellea TaxID=50990 RepID=A0A4Y7Q5N2_9AGAM|nr:hypothetical protein BD410DRAFT_828375 [Rickenella mellea]
MPSAEETQLVKDFVCDHLSRVRELSILTWPAVRVDLNDIFMAPAPLLETLSVTGMDWNAFRAVDFNLGDYYPGLKRLKIFRHSLKWGSQSIRGLRVLVPGYIHRDYQPTISALIAILYGCPALAILSLNEAGPVPDTQQASGSIGPVNLPYLQELNLTLDAEACAFFLSHMAVPSTLRWNIYCTSRISEDVREVIPRSQPGHIICTSLTITFSPVNSEFCANIHPVGEECSVIKTSLEMHSNSGLESKVWFSFCA